MPNNVRDYLDFDLGFGRNPITNDLNKRINANAIKQSVKNLVLTHFYEVPFHPEVGSQIFHALFENFSPMTKLTAERAISELRAKGNAQLRNRGRQTRKQRPCY